MALSVVAATGTHASSTATVHRHADVDVVTQEQGLIVLDQTVSGHNATTNTATVAVTVTNQRAVRIRPVRVGVGDDSASTTALAPGGTDTVRLSNVRCTETIRAESTLDSVTLRTTTPVAC